MTISTKHKFTSAKSDSADASLVQPSNWNDEHDITLAAGKVLGRDTSGDGAVQELPIAVTSGGNVGIGTSSPSEKLEVNGNIKINSGGADGGNLVLASAGYSNWNIDNYAGQLRGFYGSTTHFMWNTSGDLNMYATTGNRYLQIGTGRTGDAVSYIDLIGDTTYTDYGARFMRAAGANGDTTIYHRGTGVFRMLAYEAASITFTTSSQERMRIDSSGNVGIGATPVTKLDIGAVDSANEGAEIKLRGATNATVDWNLDVYSSDFRLFTTDKGAYSNFSEKMRIDSSGNVGIGTSSPSDKLEVGGSFRVTNGGANIAGSNAALAVQSTNGWTQIIAQRGYSSAQAAFISQPYGSYSASNPYWAMGLTGDSTGNWGLETWDGTNLTRRVTVDTSGIVTSAQLALTSTADASVSSTGHALQIGPTNSQNIIADGNEIMARNNGAISTLNLNPDGGNITIHNNTTAGTFTIGGNTVWHAGNDGPGSGLDADLWDGNQFGSYLNQAVLTSSTPSFSGLTVSNTISGYVSGAKFSNDSETKNDITTRTETGFFQTSTGTTAEGWPVNNNTWQHLISVTHSNDVNYFSMQIAGSFYDNEFYGRKTQGSGSASWVKFWTDSNDGSGSGLDADTLDGLQPSVSGVSNTIVQRHSSGYIYANYFNTTPNDVTVPITRICVETGNDGFIRHADSSMVQKFVNFNNAWVVSAEGTNRFFFASSGRTYYGSANGYEWRSSVDAKIGDLDNNGYFSANRLYANADKSCGYFFNDSGTRTAYTGGDFYIQSGVTNYYNYATNQYLGNTSGDNLYCRGNTISGNSWSMTGAGVLSLNSRFNFSHDATNANITNTTGHTLYYGPSSKDYIWHVNGVEQMRLRYNGRLGIGTSNPTQEVYVNGNAYIQGYLYVTDGIYDYSSDMRLKTDLGTIAAPLEKVKALRGFHYKPNDLAKSLGQKNTAETIGLSAQDVEAVLPELVALAPIDVGEGNVSKSGENYKTIDYARLVPLLVEALKEASSKIDSLEARVALLEKV